MRTFLAIAAALIATAGVTTSVHATTTPAQSKMQACATQWNQLKAANKTGGKDYKTFSATCMKATTPAPAAMPAMAMAKPAAAVATKPQDRMKQCAAQWNTMKTQNKTGGKTYAQFSATCLKG